VTTMTDTETRVDEMIEGLIEEAEYNYRTGELGISRVLGSRPHETRQQLDEAHWRHLARVASAFAFNPETGEYL
jgi:hypothetical protein